MAEPPNETTKNPRHRGAIIAHTGSNHRRSRCLNSLSSWRRSPP